MIVNNFISSRYDQDKEYKISNNSKNKYVLNHVNKLFKKMISNNKSNETYQIRSKNISTVILKNMI